MTTYTVEKNEEEAGLFTSAHWYIKGLPSPTSDAPDSLLLHVNEYGEPDSPHDAYEMLAALYDEFQTHDGLHEGDRFATPFGEYECFSIHVRPCFDLPPRPRKQREYDFGF